MIKPFKDDTIDFDGSVVDVGNNGGTTIDFDIDDGCAKVFDVNDNGGNFKLRTSAMISGSAVMIEGSKAFLCDDLRSKCSGGLSFPVRVEKEVIEAENFITGSPGRGIVDITFIVTGIFIAGTGTGRILLSLINWATHLSVALQ